MYYLNGGVGPLEALRKPLMVTKPTYDRAQSNLMFQPMRNRINPAHKPIWFRTKQELYVPYWTLPEYRTRDGRDPSAAKSDLLYQPYWMTNKSRARLVQRPVLQIKPKSHVLYHLGTDEEDGLGKGFKPFKAIKKVVKVVTKPKVLLNVATGGLYGIAKAGVDVAKGKTSIIGGLKTAVASYGPAGMVLTPAIGTNKSLALQAMVAGGALTAAGAAAGGAGGLLMKTGGKLLPGAFAEKPQGEIPIPADYPPMTPEGYGYTPTWTPGTVPGAPGAYPTGPVEAGMFGGLSPMMLGAMIGIPLIVQLILKGRK